eukprot:COSAG02_NODE_4871_length_4878_cov_1.630885_3_plen_188_part_00
MAGSGGEPSNPLGDASLDLISRYNHGYFCQVLGVSLENCIVTVRFHAHGDYSRGPLQGAMWSKLKLTTSGRFRPQSFPALPTDTGPEASVLHTASPRECTGEFRFKVDEKHTQGPFSFKFGRSGYSWVDIPATAFAAAATNTDGHVGSSAAPRQTVVLSEPQTDNLEDVMVEHESANPLQAARMWEV